MRGGKTDARGWGLLPVPAGSRCRGAARYRQRAPRAGSPPPPPGRMKAAGPASGPGAGGMLPGALRLLCCAATLLAAAEQQLSSGVVVIICLFVCVLVGGTAVLLVRLCRRGTPRGTPRFHHLDEVPMSKVEESPVTHPTPR
ncbi:membrane protein FAM174B-like [Neopelma chrysocephalum]|uniref:membrane protein FAM174B-like n=1 Tax=Neopelma chrysocephalum TaxID=114329 RepID=UPI000FCD1528|nr:membrane protein FAM174B-like [Neopelma chrysocephalum]